MRIGDGEKRMKTIQQLIERTNKRIEHLLAERSKYPENSCSYRGISSVIEMERNHLKRITIEVTS